jgi:hypothetical protein
MFAVMFAVPWLPMHADVVITHPSVPMKQRPRMGAVESKPYPKNASARI